MEMVDNFAEMLAQVDKEWARNESSFVAIFGTASPQDGDAAKDLKALNAVALDLRGRGFPRYEGEPIEHQIFRS